MERFEDDGTIAALESLRPAPRPAFAATLDERAAAGFPRRSQGDSPLRRLAARMRAIEPRRALLPAGATALTAVVVATVVIAGTESVPQPTDPAPTGPERHGAAQQAEPERISEDHGASSGSADSSSFQFEAAPSTAAKGYASSAPDREIERSAEMILGTDPANVRKAASEVFETVHAHRGIVLSSSIRNGEKGEAGARFELLIPSAKLGDALAAFSGIAEVRSRHEATADITAPTVHTGERLRDSQAKIEGMLAQLSRADTDAERTAVEAQLRSERRQSAYLRAQLATLQRRANLSRVSLRIETGAASSSEGTGSWGVGDALGDAGHILAIAAGVTIVGLAVVGPLALIALLAWLANRARVRRGRRRALA